MQKWHAIRHYTGDYLNRVYKYYAAHGRSYVCSYYNLDFPNSNLDSTVLDAGSYETVGELSGLRWRKILLLPVYNIEQVQPTFQADEKGFGMFEQTTTFNIPTEYEIVPSIHDFLIFDEGMDTISPDPSKYALFRIIHFEKATVGVITFWRMNVKIDYVDKPSIDNQLSGNFSFLDYEKKIYKTPVTSFLYRLLEKNSRLDGNNSFKENVGLYFLTA